MTSPSAAGHLARFLPCFACGRANVQAVQACPRPDCDLKPKERAPRRRVDSTDPEARLWGYRVGDVVSTAAGLGRVVAITEIGAASSPRLSVVLYGGEQTFHIYLSSSVKRFRSGDRR